MPTDGLFPAYVQIGYTSPYATHLMTLCMREIASSGLGDAGVVETWSGGSIAVNVMVENMIDVLAAYVPATITWNDYTVFRIPVFGADPQPIFTTTYSEIGTAVGITGQDKAVQVTLGFRTEAFGQARIVVLDRPSNGFFGSNQVTGGVNAAVISEFTSSANAWAGRDGYRPAAYTNTSISLNKRLRRKYDMI